jgi:Arylsulfotransferase (ASST)
MWSRSLLSAFTNTKTRLTAVTTIALTAATVFATAGGDDRANAVAKTADAKNDSARKSVTPPLPEKLGVLQNDSRACPGYNLINPGRKQTYLYDNEGRVVHSWTSEYSSGAAVYLLSNGHLFRPAEAPSRNRKFQGPAASGRFQELDWDGNLVWDFEYHSDKRMPHHDAIMLPNGNALLICWEMIDEKEAVAAGRRPETVKSSHLQPDCLVEIKPTGKSSGEIVWEWRTWDHLIQDLDKSKPGFGDISQHPELFDLNYTRADEDRPPRTAAAGDTKKNGLPPPVRKNPDWMHVNAVAYNADLDQVALSSPNFCEIWIIDHSTTTEQAKGHTGGRRGKGGDILYRWGNPRAYKNGTTLDRRLFFQHNIQWIPKGLSGAGHLLVFNNGGGRKPEEYSSVDEFVPPTDKDGHYIRPKGGPFGPAAPLWSYTAPNKKDFFSWFISGAQRLPNGNTLINAGAYGIVFEVTPEGETVWKFANPFKPVRSTPPIANAAPKRPDPAATANRDAQDRAKDQRTVDAPQKARIADTKKGQVVAGPGRGTPRKQGNTLFRATRYALDHTAFAGKTFKPGKTLVEIEENSR